MEPRPQRPRTQPVPQSPTQGGGAGQPGASARPGDYPHGVDPATFIAPSRTEYDYSPLDLAPSGQRRRRQFVAAAVGGMVVLLIASVAFFGYLVFRDDPPADTNDDVLAAQTQVAMQEATLSAQQTAVADAAVEQTAQAGGGSNGDTTTPASDATDAARTDETPATTDEGAPTTAPDATGTATTDAGSGEGPTAEELAALLPAANEAPTGLDDVVDNELDFQGVVDALGGSRTAETNLESWGWSGNAARQFNPSDPSAIEASGVSVLTVSIHGFATPEAAAEALPFFSDILVNNGYKEAEAPKLGDNARMLTTTQEDGSSEVALYVQDGQMLYRVTGASVEGDPTKAVTDITSGMLAGVPQLTAALPADRRS